MNKRAAERREDIARCVIFECRTLIDVAREYGITASRVGQIVARHCTDTAPDEYAQMKYRSHGGYQLIKIMQNSPHLFTRRVAA